MHVALVRRGDRGKQVAVLIVENVLRDMRHTLLVQNALFPVLRAELHQSRKVNILGMTESCIMHE